MLFSVLFLPESVEAESDTKRMCVLMGFQPESVEVESDAKEMCVARERRNLE